MKSKKGITLIALVITIVILIILAAVSIQTIIGENGIIQQAKEAQNITQNAQIDTDQKMNSLYSEMEDLLTDKLVLKEGDIQFLLSNKEDTNENIELTIKAVEKRDSIVQYKIGEEGEWNTYETPLIIEKNDIVYARYSNEKEVTEATYIEIKNIDKLSPKIEGIDSSRENTTVFLKANVIDEETQDYKSSGIEGYRFSVDNGASWSNWQQSDTYSIVARDIGSSYQVKVEAKDKVGNIAQLQEAAIVNTPTYLIKSGYGTAYNNTEYLGNFSKTSDNYTQDSFSIKNNGSNVQFTYYNADVMAGHSETWSASTTINVDNYKKIYFKFRSYGSSTVPRNGEYLVTFSSIRMFYYSYYNNNVSSNDTGVITSSFDISNLKGKQGISIYLSSCITTLNVQIYDLWLE